jgi:hypothetical protein
MPGVALEGGGRDLGSVKTRGHGEGACMTGI